LTSRLSFVIIILIFLLCLLPLFFLGSLLFQPLIGLLPHFFEVVGLGNARFFSASPVQPPWYLHDLIPSCARAWLLRAAGASLSNTASVFSTAAVDL
jgi:hypothetical protein